MMNSNGFIMDPTDTFDNESSGTPENTYIAFICKLEGWKTRCKNLHWASRKKNIHVYLDDFLGVISDYQDGLAEEIMGINGRMSPTAISGIAPKSEDPWSFIDEIRADTLSFYSSIPDSPIMAGLKSECETFIHNINKYVYLFSLCERL